MSSNCISPSNNKTWPRPRMPSGRFNPTWAPNAFCPLPREPQANPVNKSSVEIARSTTTTTTPAAKPAKPAKSAEPAKPGESARLLRLRVFQMLIVWKWPPGRGVFARAALQYCLGRKERERDRGKEKEREYVQWDAENWSDSVETFHSTKSS